MPSDRNGFAIAEVNGKVYAIGGRAYTDSTPYGTVEQYDPVTDMWTIKASMPTPRFNLGVAVVQGKIYAIGGAVHYGLDVLNTVEEYNPDTNTWSTKASMPTARSGFGISAVNNKIYTIGGTEGHNPDNGKMTVSAKVEVYDPATNSWASKASIPVPRMQCAAAAVNNKIYLIGGIDNSTIPLNQNDSVSRLEEYTPGSDTWTVKAPMPTPRNSMSAAVLNSEIYVAGGVYTVMYTSNSGQRFSLNKVEKYNPLTDAWIQGQ